MYFYILFCNNMLLKITIVLEFAIESIHPSYIEKGIVPKDIILIINNI